MSSFRNLNMMFQQRQPVMQQAMAPAQRGPNAGIRRPGMIGAPNIQRPVMPPQGAYGGLARYGMGMAAPGVGTPGMGYNDIPPVGMQGRYPGRAV